MSRSVASIGQPELSAPSQPWLAARAGLLVLVAVVAGMVSFPPFVSAQAPLPIVDNAEPALLRDHCRRLLEALERLSMLSKEEQQELRELLRGDGVAEVDVKLQKLLDGHCLAGVNINPESRVKVARGPAPGDLVLDRETVFLIKVHNEAGVSDALRISGQQLLVPREAERDTSRWLELAVLSGKPLAKTLSGQKLEYVVVRLKAREAGKREATLKFDVGQGTQDLGFRAEVPVLFTIKR